MTRKEFTCIVVRRKSGGYLFCFRTKKPWYGLYNFVGGKKEPNEFLIDCAVRELYEETGIVVNEKDIDIQPLFKLEMDHPDGENFPDDNTLIGFYGITPVRDDIELVEEINPLLWLSKEYILNNEEKFAGEGWIKMAILYYERLLERGLFGEEQKTTS